MSSNSSSSMAHVVVFDDGGLTGASVRRIAQYADRATVVGGTRRAAVCNLLASAGVAATSGDCPMDGVTGALAIAAESGNALVATGLPLDGAALIGGIDAWLAGARGAGCIVHVVAPIPAPVLYVAARTEAATTWTARVAAAFAKTLGVRGDVLATSAESTLAEQAEAGAGDLVLVATQTAAPPSVPAESAAPPLVSAAEVIHLILTDTSLIMTNRTRFAVSIRVRLGSATQRHRDLGAVGADLNPGSSVEFGPAQLTFLADVAPPAPILRQWSHEAEIIYEGGSRRINTVDARYISATGELLGTTHIDAGRGLVVGITGTEIARAIGHTLHSIGPRVTVLAGQRPDPIATLAAQLAEPPHGTRSRHAEALA